MKHYYFKDKEIKIGDTIAMDNYFPVLGKLSTNITIDTQEKMNYLVEVGDIKVEEVPDNKVMKESKYSPTIEKNLSLIRSNVLDYIDLGGDYKTFLANYLFDNFPLQLFQILSKEIAVDLDKQYGDHIKYCDWVYLIDDVDGKPFEVYQEHYSNKEWYNLIKNIACFRTKEDAIACKIALKELKKYVWSIVPKSGK